MEERRDPQLNKNQRRPYARWGSKLLLALISTVLALVIAEVVVRKLRIAPRVHAINTSDELSAYQRSSNPILRYELKPNYGAQFSVGRATTNSDGFRDIQREGVKREGVKRIVVLGDSVVEGINYVADDETITRQWNSLFDSEETEVLNFGTAGYCTRAEVELLKTRGLPYDPDLVVVIFTANDFQNFNPEHTLEGTIRKRPASLNRLFEKVDLVRLACLHFNLFGFRDELDSSSWHQRAMQENNVVTGLRELRTLADEHEFEVLVAIWPYFLDEDIVDVDPMPDGTGALIVERLAWMNSIPTVRLSKYFIDHWQAHSPAGNPKNVYTVRADQMHPNPLGCQIAAQSLHQLIDRSAWELPTEHGKLDLLAMDAAEQISRETSDTTVSNLVVAQVLARQGRLTEKKAYLEQSVRDNPDDVQAHYELGLIYGRQKKFDLAETHFREVIRLTPDEPEAYFFLAHVLNQQGETDESDSHLRQGLGLWPDQQADAQSAMHFVRQQLKMEHPEEPPPVRVDSWN